jgi:hypothetical protein
LAVAGRSLSIDLLRDGRPTSVAASDSEPVIVGAMLGAMLEAIDIVLTCSWLVVDEAMLVVLVWVPGIVP